MPKTLENDLSYPDSLIDGTGKERIGGKGAVHEDEELALVRGAQLYLDSRRLHRDVDRVSAEAWERFFCEYERIVNQLARRSVCSRFDESDCAQQIWTEILAKLTCFQCDHTRGHFRDWLLAVIAHTISDHRRHQFRHRVEHLSLDIENGLPGRESDPAVQYEQQCLRTEVRGLLSALKSQVSKDSYQVFHLLYIEERSVREVAEHLHMTPKRVRDRLARMKVKFRKLIEQHSHEFPTSSFSDE